MALRSEADISFRTMCRAKAEFYSFAAYGHGLDNATRGGGPPSVGGQKAQLSQDAQVLQKQCVLITEVVCMRLMAQHP